MSLLSWTALKKNAANNHDIHPSLNTEECPAPVAFSKLIAMHSNIKQCVSGKPFQFFRKVSVDHLTPLVLSTLVFASSKNC
jgi:hypothetical protein